MKTIKGTVKKADILAFRTENPDGGILKGDKISPAAIREQKRLDREEGYSVILVRK